MTTIIIISWRLFFVCSWCLQGTALCCWPLMHTGCAWFGSPSFTLYSICSSSGSADLWPENDVLLAVVWNGCKVLVTSERAQQSQYRSVKLDVDSIWSWPVFREEKDWMTHELSLWHVSLPEAAAKGDVLHLALCPASFSLFFSSSAPILRSDDQTMRKENELMLLTLLLCTRWVWFSPRQSPSWWQLTAP